ncbi:hemerythrin domain-containing protein [Asticcacaulis solisilvae]|uniref:hemerythrin domain-containing protein n=1 Tax=Asticcacaulis solisilvae TaxID=1217274 RepID=UPI003FD79869
MDIYSYIQRDHRKVAELMDDLLAINLSAVQLNIFDRIKTELELHAASEEQTFYAALEEASRKASVEDRVVHARADHDEIRGLLMYLSTESIAAPLWMEKFGELKHAVEHHVREEEGEIFTKARKLLSPEQARQLGRDMDRVKRTLHSPQTEEAAGLRL